MTKAIFILMGITILAAGILGFTIQESTSSLSSNTPDDFSITIKPILSLVLADSDDDDDDARDDDDDDDDACSPGFTCVLSDDEDVCPAGFTCEQECDDEGDCELKECEVDDANAADDNNDGVCAQPVGNLVTCQCLDNGEQLLLICTDVACDALSPTFCEEQLGPLVLGLVVGCQGETVISCEPSELCFTNAVQ